MKKNSVIYIAQYHGTSLISRLIRWRTWSKISHTAAFLFDEKEVIEAWNGKVMRQPWTQGHAPGTKIEIFKVACTADQRRKFYSFLKAQVGKKYDFWAILGFMTRAKSADSDKWFCSEMVISAANQAGINLLKRVEPHQVSPGLLNVSPALIPFKTMRVPDGREQKTRNTPDVDGSGDPNYSWM